MWYFVTTVYWESFEGEKFANPVGVSQSLLYTCIMDVIVDNQAFEIHRSKLDVFVLFVHYFLRNTTERQGRSL